MTKVVQLSNDAYRLLTNAKRRGESYSDVITRLLRQGDLRNLRGLREPEEIARHEADLARIDAMDLPGQ